MSKRNTPAFAIIRIDDHEEKTPIENVFTIQKVMLVMEEAQEEVNRLNKLNADKGCKYFLKQTRLRMK